MKHNNKNYNMLCLRLSRYDGFFVSPHHVLVTSFAPSPPQAGSSAASVA